MRLEATNDPDRTKVWLTDEEIEDLRRATASYRDDIIIQLGAYVGLRAFEIPQVQPRHIKETENGSYRLRTPEGKDTTAMAASRVTPFSRPMSSGRSNSTRTPRTSRRKTPISI